MNKSRSRVLCAAAAISLGAAANNKPASLDWFEGHWCAERNGEFTEEQWLSGRGDIWLGVSQTVKDRKTVSFEFMRVQVHEGILSYIVQPQGAPPTVFRLENLGMDFVRFTNPANDFPQRIEYRRTKGGLFAEISGPGKDGKPFAIPFDYRACPR
jgi:hypothetical protein